MSVLCKEYLFPVEPPHPFPLRMAESLVGYSEDLVSRGRPTPSAASKLAGGGVVGGGGRFAQPFLFGWAGRAHLASFSGRH